MLTDKINVRYFKYIADGESMTVLPLKKDISSPLLSGGIVCVTAREAKPEDHIYLGYRDRENYKQNDLLIECF